MTAETTTPSTAEILEAFEHSFRPVRVRLIYRLGLVLVAVAMVALPLIYVGLILLVGYGLWFHITNASFWFRTGASGVRTFIFIALVVIGAVTLLFMIKPLFARRAARQTPLRLDPVEEERLFAFVRRICEIVGAPIPREIHANCEVNAFASLRRGFLSFLGSDLVLTIGLPLVAGLDTRQFAGVLAHEFGHFAQGTAMRLTYVIRGVNFWFARVVYERDAWDQRLEQSSRAWDPRVMAIMLASRFFVFLTRGILWSLMMLGHAISCFMMRQMEFDADRYEARTSGSESFESTLVRMHQLNAATENAFQLMAQFWREGRLPEDLPHLIEQRAAAIPGEVNERIQAHIRSEETAILDTHPSDRARIENARRERAAGVFRLELPSTILLSDFEGLSRGATLLYYDLMLGDAARQVPLMSNATLLEGSTLRETRQECLKRYFQVPLPITRTLRTPARLEPLERWKDAYVKLVDSRKAMEQAIAPTMTALEKYEQALLRHGKARLAKEVIQSNLPLSPEEFDLPELTLDCAESAMNASVVEQRESEPQIDEFGALVRTRLVSALQLLEHPSVSLRIPDAAEMREEIERYVRTLAMLEGMHETFCSLRDRLAESMLLVENLAGNEENRSLTGNLLGCAAEMRRDLLLFRKTLTAKYPFEHARPDLPIHAYLVPDELADADVLGPLLDQVGRALDGFEELYIRLLGSLALAAERVEGALGLKPLEP